MRNRLSVIAAICAALLLVGSGCMSEDVDTLFSFLNDWAVGHNIVTADGKPTSQTIKYVGSGGFISTGDPTVDAATDAGAAVQGVVQADQKLDDADAALADGTQNGRAKALELSAEAVKDRPDDQEVRTRRGVIMSESGDVEGGRKYMVTYDQSCDPAKNSGMTDQQKKQCLHNVGDEAGRISDANTRKGFNTMDCAMMREEKDAYDRAEQLAQAAGDKDAQSKYRDLGFKASQSIVSFCTRYKPPYDPDIDD